MAYVKQNFVDGQVLTAEELNHIENGVVDNQVAISTKANASNADFYGRVVVLDGDPEFVQIEPTKIIFTNDDEVNYLNITKDNISIIDNESQDKFVVNINASGISFDATNSGSQIIPIVIQQETSGSGYIYSPNIGIETSQTVVSKYVLRLSDVLTSTDAVLKTLGEVQCQLVNKKYVDGAIDALRQELINAGILS